MYTSSWHGTLLNTTTTLPLPHRYCSGIQRVVRGSPVTISKSGMLPRVLFNVGARSSMCTLTPSNAHQSGQFRWNRSWLNCFTIHVRGSFEKFVDSPNYSESELCGGAVTVSFSKYFPWQAMHFLQRSTHFSKTCCRPVITSKFLASELPFHSLKNLEIARGEIWTVWRIF
jgi:hypothetical protein